MDTKPERIFGLLELNCFPKGCLLPEDSHDPLATVFVPKLEAVGMKTAEWTRGALMLEEPHLTKVRGIVCRGCHMTECQFFLPREPASDLRDLKVGQSAERDKKGDRILEQLLPEKRKTELEQMGIECVAFQMPSRKNPKLVFSFSRGGVKRRVSCYIGERRLRTNEGDEPLFSLEQVSGKIAEAIRALP